jgi:hypothetical protein
LLAYYFGPAEEINPMRNIRQGSPEDPIQTLRDDVDTLRDQVATLQETINSNHQSITKALADILQELGILSDNAAP